MLTFVISFIVVLILITKVKWFIHSDCKSKVCLVGKTALVTGGNSGIGYHIALGLLQRGCRVIIADKIKNQNLLEDIFRETNSRNVVFEYADLSSFQSTRELANAINKNEEKLDILIHNAGVARDIFLTTKDDLDVIMQINHFSPFLLTHLLVGIGYQTVLSLAQRGCRVIIADKTQDEKLLQNIFEETHNKNIVFKYVDLGSFNSVRKLANDIINNEENLDILINNAGIANSFKTSSEDHLNMALQVNYLSAFLLTHLLLDLLKKSKGRIIFTSSLMSLISNLTLENLKTVIEKINCQFHYPNSKLCCLVAGDIFAEKLKNYGVTSNTYHPGLVYTNIFTYGYRNEMAISKFLSNITSFLAFLVGKSSEEGAQTAIYLACANEVENVTGEYFFETKKTFKPKLARHKKFCQSVWEISEELVGLKPDEKI